MRRKYLIIYLLFAFLLAVLMTSRYYFSIKEYRPIGHDSKGINDLKDEILFDISVHKGVQALAGFYIVDLEYTEEEWREAAQMAIDQARIEGILPENYTVELDPSQEVAELRAYHSRLRAKAFSKYLIRYLIGVAAASVILVVLSIFDEKFDDSPKMAK